MNDIKGLCSSNAYDVACPNNIHILIIISLYTIPSGSPSIPSLFVDCLLALVVYDFRDFSIKSKKLPKCIFIF